MSQKNENYPNLLLLFQSFYSMRKFYYLIFFLFVAFSQPAFAESFFSGGTDPGLLDPGLFANAKGTDPKTSGSQMDKQKMTEYRQLNFRHQVAKTNLWFFPVAALGSGGLGFLFIQIPPDNLWQTIVYVYGWAGIGAAAVAVGLSFYAIYDYNKTKSALKKFRQDNHLSFGRPVYLPLNRMGNDYSFNTVYLKEVNPYISGQNGYNEIFYLPVFRSLFG